MSRELQMKQMLLEGKTLEEVGSAFNVSKERVRQIRNKHFPELTRKNTGASLRLCNRLYAKQANWLEKYNRATYQNLTELQAAQSRCFSRKRQNVRHQGKWEFSITMSQIEWPTHCPILGIELDWFNEFRAENSPSFDRIDPTKGYVPGNVAIVSWRANRIKNDGYAKEHRSIAEWMEKQSFLQDEQPS